jgi:hypothetical protein
VDVEQESFRCFELPFDEGSVKDQFRLLAGDLGLPPPFDLAPHRLEIPLDAIYANRERVDQVEALGVLCENRLKVSAECHISTHKNSDTTAKAEAQTLVV